MQAYVEGEDGCRRKIPGAYVDGDKERGRCRADGEACDLCRPDESVGEQGDGHNEQAKRMVTEGGRMRVSGMRWQSRCRSSCHARETSDGGASETYERADGGSR
jgi:hypothetical protein